MPNAKVREEYSQLIKIDDPDICEYWLEGLEDTGLQAELEIILNPTEEKMIPDNYVSESAMSSNEDNAPSKTTNSTDFNKGTEVEKQMHKCFLTQESLVPMCEESWLRVFR